MYNDVVISMAKDAQCNIKCGAEFKYGNDSQNDYLN